MKKCILSIGCLLLVTFTVSGCSKKHTEQEKDIPKANNDVFTTELHDALKEINVWYGGKKLVIDKQKDIDIIYNSFASLKLTEFTPEPGKMKMGHMIIDLITKDGKESVGLLSGEINFNGKSYYTDKNIVDTVRETALKYKKD